MAQAKHSTYELSAKRKQVLSIRTSKGDNTEEWDAIVDWLKVKGSPSSKSDSGNAKDGLYNLAKENGII